LRPVAPPADKPKPDNQMVVIGVVTLAIVIAVVIAISVTQTGERAYNDTGDMNMMDTTLLIPT